MTNDSYLFSRYTIPHIYYITIYILIYYIAFKRGLDARKINCHNCHLSLLADSLREVASSLRGTGRAPPSPPALLRGRMPRRRALAGRSRALWEVLKYKKEPSFLGDNSWVIRMGLEPMTRSLEGCCSNPTELPNRPLSIKLRILFDSRILATWANADQGYTLRARIRLQN